MVASKASQNYKYFETQKFVVSNNFTVALNLQLVASKQNIMVLNPHPIKINAYRLIT